MALGALVRLRYRWTHPARCEGIGRPLVRRALVFEPALRRIGSGGDQCDEWSELKMSERICRRWALGLGLAVCLAGRVQAAESEAAAKTPPVVRDVVYAKVGSVDLKADVFLPAGDGPFPTVLVLHGGGWALGNKEQMDFHGRRLARRGYAAVSIDYRLAPKFKFPAQIEDCRAALAWMRREADHYHFDRNWMAVFGYSAGGQLAALLGVTEAKELANQKDPPPRLRAVVAGGAPCDFSATPPQLAILKYWLGGTRGELPEIYNQASPLLFVSVDSPPTFFYHGDSDVLVPANTSQAMAKALEKAGVPVETHVVRDSGHVKAFFDRQAVEAAIDYLDRQRKAAAK